MHTGKDEKIYGILSDQDTNDKKLNLYKWINWKTV